MQDPQVSEGSSPLQTLAGRLLLAEASLGFGVAVMHGTRFAWANPAYLELSGYTLEELLALPNSLALIPPEELPRMADLQARFMRREPLPASFETRLVRKGGDLIDVEACVQILTDPDPGVLFCVRNIAETKRLNRELQAKDRILVEAQRLSGMATYVWDAKTGVVSANQRLFEIWGVPADGIRARATVGAEDNNVLFELAGDQFAEFMKVVHPEDAPALRESGDTLLRTGGPVTTEYRVLVEGRGPRRLRRTAVAERAPDGTIARVIGTIQDVTDDFEGLIANRMVQHLFEDLIEGSLSTTEQRAYGRRLATRSAVEDIEALLRSYSLLGLGFITLRSASGGRYLFSAGDLIGSGRRGRLAGCHLALGFLEGVVSQHTHQEALGTETSCRRRGDPTCEFTISGR